MHKTTQDSIRPTLFLRQMGHKYPTAWGQYEKFRQMRGPAFEEWPDWCYCPMAAAYAIISQGKAINTVPDGPREIAVLAALATWRVSQGVYRFDPTLAAAILETPITGLPVDVLYNLPEWCVYVEAPAGLQWFGDSLEGFFAHLEFDMNTRRHELRLVFDCAGQNLFGFPLHLAGKSLEEAIELAIAESRRQQERQGNVLEISRDFVEELRGNLTPIINLILYICSANADFGSKAPQRPKPHKTKKGWRLFAPNTPVRWDIGTRIGTALRATHEPTQVQSLHQDSPADHSERARPRPHVRRAHWHTYRTGTGRINQILKWLPPIPINLDNLECMPATIHLVQEDRN